MLSNFMRYTHYVAVGAQAIAMVLFIWGYTVMRGPAWVVMAGWCAFYGALSLHALLKDHKERKGIRA